MRATDSGKPSRERRDTVRRMAAFLGQGGAARGAGAGPEPALGSYAAWVRAAIGSLIESRGEAISLFDSSVPEPVELLRAMLADAFGHGLTSRYTSAFVSGNPFVVRQLQQRYGVGADSILCTTGATGALSLLYRAFLGAGDRVLVENPGFDLFAGFGEALHVGVDRFDRNPRDFMLDPARVAAAVRPRTRLIVVSNLHNPSGALTGDAELREVARIAARAGAHLIVDEVYREYAPDSVRPAPAMTLGDNVVSVSSLTKIYGLSTLRCGWVVAHPAIVARVRALHDEFEFGVSKLAHAVAALVLETPAPYEAFHRASLEAARPIMERYHAGWIADGLVTGEMPAHGCIYFPRLVGVDDTAAFARQLSDEHRVFVAPGEFFGAPGHVRIGFAQDPSRLDDGLRRLTAALQVARAGR
jgi:aspartate/methionine/tyrosine aminotransferase